jgi:glycosyltransferase involved in cell wall biosynthesis
MWSKILNSLKASKATPSASLETSLDMLARIRHQSEILAVCPDNTGSNWLGIKQGTIALFPNSTWIMPHYYSKPSFSETQLSRIYSEIKRLQFKKLVIRGFSDFFESMIVDLKKIFPEIEVYVMYAGGASEFSHTAHRNFYSKIVALTKEGLITKVGFNKKGLSEATELLYGIPCGHYLMKSTIYETPNPVTVQQHNCVKIGVLGGSTFNKNTHTQVIAALTLPNSEVYAFNANQYSYLGMDHRIKALAGPFDHSAFVELLSQMDVNYYLAFSESWGHIIAESLSVGVPCLTTPGSGVLSYNEELKELLTVKDYDNILAIKEQTENVLKNHKKISEMGKQYVHSLNQKADFFLHAFLYT